MGDAIVGEKFRCEVTMLPPIDLRLGLIVVVQIDSMVDFMINWSNYGTKSLLKIKYFMTTFT